MTVLSINAMLTIEEMLIKEHDKTEIEYVLQCLNLLVRLGACRGGEVGQVGHQVVLVERSGELR